MKTFGKIVLAAAVVLPTVFTGCKKGENDPFISLRSRKARMAGEWNVQDGTGKTTTTGSGYSQVEDWTYDGTKESTTTTTTSGSGSTTSTDTDNYTTEYTFEKDGSFKMVQTDTDSSPSVVTTTTGVWNFTGGAGDTKEKSQLLIMVNSITSGSTTTTYEGSEAPTLVYDIDQLKNKEIILKRNGSAPGVFGTTVVTEESWTLAAK
jgi:hypothetical protein